MPSREPRWCILVGPQGWQGGGGRAVKVIPQPPRDGPHPRVDFDDRPAVGDSRAEHGEDLRDRRHQHQRGGNGHHHFDERHAAAGHSMILRSSTASHTL